MRVVTLLCVLILVAGAAVANASEKDPMHGPTSFVPLSDEGGRAVGDDCTDPHMITTLPYYGTGFTNCGALNNYTETCLGSYDGGEDAIFQLEITEQVWVNIIMDPLGTTWTGIAIDDECPPAASCIAYNTGSSGVRTISQVGLAPGTYYIMVDTWPSPDCIPEFNLTIEPTDPPPPPPVNDQCAGAIELVRCESGSIEGDLTWALNDYDPGVPGPSCTNYAAAGKDVTFKVWLEVGDILDLLYTSPAFDGSNYVITDCDDETGTCVAGVDDPEPGHINWTATATGWYYIIADAYGTNAGGPFTLDWSVTCAEPGACCFADGTCELVLQSECAGLGGAWDGGETCDPNPCPQPGACCFPDGTCQVLSEEDCLEADGQFNGGPCDPNPCEVIPTDETSWGQIKSQYR